MTPIQMLRSSWDFYKAHWKVLALIVGTPAIILYLGSFLTLLDSAVASIIGLLVSLIGVIATLIVQPAAIDSIRKLESDPTTQISIKSQYKYGLGLFWSTIFVMIITLLILAGASMLFVIPGIVVSLYIGFYIFALVLDDKRGFATLTESYALVKGRWWPVLGRMCVLILISLASSLVTAGLGFIFRKVFGLGLESTAYLGFSSIVNIVFYVFLTPLLMIYTYKVYNWLKTTRSAEVPTAGMKKWLVTFLVIGVVAIFTIPILFIGAMSSLDTAREMHSQTNIQKY